MTSQFTSLKRVKRKIKASQNPLFEKWLKEWKEQATKDGCEMRFVFNKALRSLQKYPLKLNTGEDCSILENFGPKLCKMIDDKLEAYKASHLEDGNLTSEKLSKKMSKNENVVHNCGIIEEVMGGYGCKIKNSEDTLPVRVAEGLQSEEESGRAETAIIDQVDNILSQEKEFEGSSESETIFMEPGTFQIKLLVDTQERDDKLQEGANMTVKKLTNKSVNFEMRHLKVGDFIWVARNNDGLELVLPYIVERKRFDDLASSIKDGRFHEQKFRLKQSGIENLIYLVEKYGNENQRLGLPLPTLLQAISNTQVTGGFTVKVTNNHDHSMRYLNCLTNRLTQLFQAKTLMSCKKSNLCPVNLSDDLVPLLTFKEFNRGSEKNKKPTIRNMFLNHLLQLNGVSIEKAKAIVQLYPTPRVLMKGLKRPSGEKSIADLTVGGCKRTVGPVTARHINLLYTSPSLG